MADPLYDLVRDLREAADGATGAAHDVVKRGAINVKRDWRANVKRSAGRHARAYPYSIGFDITRSPVVVMAEIGPDKAARQGPLGNLIEFGSVNNPPHNDGGRALRAEEPKFLKAMDEAVGKLL